MAERILILDRDGVINEDSDQYIKEPAEWEAIAGSVDAVARLCHSGYRVCVATNQSGLARDLFGLAELNAIHRKLRDSLAKQGGQVEMIAFCPHGPGEGCGCRKPAPGLLLAIAERFGVPASGIPYVGDSLRDMEAAKAAGMTPFLVLTGKGLHTLEEQAEGLVGVAIFQDLRAVADFLLAGQRP